MQEKICNIKTIQNVFVIRTQKKTQGCTKTGKLSFAFFFLMVRISDVIKTLLTAAHVIS